MFDPSTLADPIKLSPAEETEVQQQLAAELARQWFIYHVSAKAHMAAGIDPVDVAAQRDRLLAALVATTDHFDLEVVLEVPAQQEIFQWLSDDWGKMQAKEQMLAQVNQMFQGSAAEEHAATSVKVGTLRKALVAVAKAWDFHDLSLDKTTSNLPVGEAAPVVLEAVAASVP